MKASPVPPWIFTLCFLKLKSCWNCLKHTSHSKTESPDEWSNMWCPKLLACVNVFLHTLQWNGFVDPCVIICVFQWEWQSKVFPQALQANALLSAFLWNALMWARNARKSENFSPHNSHSWFRLGMCRSLWAFNFVVLSNLALHMLHSKPSGSREWERRCRFRLEFWVNCFPTSVTLIRFAPGVGA